MLQSIQFLILHIWEEKSICVVLYCRFILNERVNLKFLTEKSWSVCFLPLAFFPSVFLPLPLFLIRIKCPKKELDVVMSIILTESKTEGMQNKLTLYFLCRSLSGCYILCRLCYKVNNFWQLVWFSPLLSLWQTILRRTLVLKREAYCVWILSLKAF